MGYLSHVKRIPTEFFRLLESHDLNFKRPAGIVSSCNCIVQIASCVIGIVSSQLMRSSSVKVFNTLLTLFKKEIQYQLQCRTPFLP